MAPTPILSSWAPVLRREVDHTKFKYYYFQPSLTAAVLFIVLFSIVTLVHFGKMIRTRKWFMIPFVLGGICEIIGYIARAISAGETYGDWTLGPFIIQSVFLLIAPALFAASVYMQFGHLVQQVEGEKFLFIRRTWLTKIFVAGDIISFLMQGAGAGLEASKSSSSTKTGSNIIVGGLFVQVLFFGLFVIASAIFDHKFSKNRKSSEVVKDIPYRRVMIAIYLISAFIFVRNIVRVVEFLEGYGGYVMAHEAFLYVFDAHMMWWTMIAGLALGV